MKRSRPVLVVAPSVEEAWDDAIGPWFEEVGPGAWKHPLPSLVVVPTRGHVNDLRARLIAKGFSHLGLQFVTPASLRALLARDDAAPPANPEHLRLLLAIAASEMEDRSNESEALAAKAVARAPTLLLRALDRLETAGWKFEELALPSFAPVVHRFNELLKKCDFVLPGETDRRRLQKAARGERKFSHALITGFDGAHWSNWRKTPPSCSRNRERLFPTSIFAGSAHGKRCAVKRNARRNPRGGLVIRFLVKRKCAEARKRQSASIF
jgi:hypothetical protein